MSLEKDLQDGFAKMLEKDGAFSATVISVDKVKGTCIVSDGELEYKVRLSSVINESQEKFFLYPKLKSKVLVGLIEEDLNQLYVVKYSAIEQLRLKIANCDLCIDEGGFNFKRENESLRSLMLELLSEIQKMVFTTNMGPTIKLVNKPKFQVLETKFKNLLKDI